MEMEDSPREHRSKDSRKRSREEEKDHRGRDREHERSKRSGGDEIVKERRKDDRSDREKDRSRDSKVRDKERDHDRDKHREKEREREKDRKDRERDRDVEKESDRGRDKDKGKEKSRHRDKEKEKERDRTKEKEKIKDREERDGELDRNREKGKEKTRDQEKEKPRDRDKASRRSHDSDHEDRDDEEQNAAGGRGAVQTSELEDRIQKMKEDRLKSKSEPVSEVLSWVSKSRKLEEKKNAEKEKALQLSKIFEEQDNIDQGESEDEEDGKRATTTSDLAGVKVLHGLEKVVEGGAVVFTLKDQSILANGDVNEDVDMLENYELGEQKRRDDAYKAAKKKAGVYEDKFNDEPGVVKKMLPQYDDPAAEEGVTLDERGRFNVEAEKKLEELRKRIQGATSSTRVEDLNIIGKVSSDYYTQEEMLKFKKPKKKKSLRKKDKLDLDALEAEAKSAGLGSEDLGSRKDAKRQAIKDEKERSEAERRNNAYQSALAKADEASKLLRLGHTLPPNAEDDGNQGADDDEDLYKSLEKARKLALKKQEEVTGPQAIARLATSVSAARTSDDQNTTTEESQENKVVFTEMEEFVWGLQLDEEAQNPADEAVFMDQDEVPTAPDQDGKDKPDEATGWNEVEDTVMDENPAKEDSEEIVPDKTIHEATVGKGLSGALMLLKDRGTLKENVEWGGRNMDKKKSKLVGIRSEGGNKKERFDDLTIERTDEFGRILTPKEAFRILSHKFHGKGPGKMKQEKKMKQYQEELKLKQMKNSDTPSMSAERMREAQAQLKTPYLVLSGNVKPGQTSDPRSGYATVEKDLPGGLTPMLGDKKVEHFLGIKRPEGLRKPKT